MGFTDSITGQNGVLTRQQIQSPNFVTGVSGWIVRKDGTVEFNSGTFRGNIVLTNSGAILEYNAGIPGPNVLGVALAPAAGSDAFGNPYNPGLNVYDSLGSATGTWGGGTGFSMQDPNNQLLKMNVAVPLQLPSPTFNDASPGIIKSVRSDIIANHDTLQILGPVPLGAVDPNSSSINYKVSAGASANGADARFVFHNNGGDTVMLQFTNGLVQLPIGVTLGNKETINSSSPAGALTIFQNVATSTNPGTISIQETAAGNGSLAAFVSGDAHARYVLRASGQMDFSSGTLSSDVSFGRAGLNTLFSSRNLLIGGSSVLGDNGVGELAFANVTTIPTVAPTGGGLLYSKQAVPVWQDTGNNTLAMVRSNGSNANADLLNFTAETDIPNASVTVKVTGSNSTVVITGNFDMQMNGTAGTLIGFLNWNGADRTEQAVYTVPTAGSRQMVSRTWIITGVAAGTYTAKLRASCSVANASNGVRTVHTGIIARVEEG